MYGVRRATCSIKLATRLNRVEACSSFPIKKITLGINSSKVSRPIGPTGIRDKLCFKDKIASAKGLASF